MGGVALVGGCGGCGGVCVSVRDRGHNNRGREERAKQGVSAESSARVWERHCPRKERDRGCGAKLVEERREGARQPVLPSVLSPPATRLILCLLSSGLWSRFANALGHLLRYGFSRLSGLTSARAAKASSLPCHTTEYVRLALTGERANRGCAAFPLLRCPQ